MLGFCSCWLTVWLKILWVSTRTISGYNFDCYEFLPGEQHWFWMAAALTDSAQIVHRLVVLLLVMDKGGAVRPRPIASVTLVRVLPCVTPSVVYQVIRALQRESYSNVSRDFEAVKLDYEFLLYLP